MNFLLIVVVVAMNNVTAMMITSTNYSALRDFYIGLTLAASSGIFIGTSFIFTKKGLLRLTVRAGMVISNF